MLEALRRVVGAAPQGASLPSRRDLCARLGVSTFRLHQSMRQLEREGLIKVIPRRGIFVRERRPAQSQFVQMVYLDNPDPGSGIATDYGLSGFLLAVGRQKMTCRVTHVHFRDMEGLGDALRQAAGEADCAGTVVSGCVTGEAARLLEKVHQPFVVGVDVFTEELWPRLPVVCGDGFQGGMLAAEKALARGCDHLMLVRFKGATDWPWIREPRAGVMAALQKRGPLHTLFIGGRGADPEEMRRQTEAWLAGSPGARVGVVCRNMEALQSLTPVRQFLAERRAEQAVVLMDVGMPGEPIPGVQTVLCSMTALAEAALRRLDAMRRGADSPGRLRVPYCCADQGTGG